MFESDQHEFDDEYVEIGHPAPPVSIPTPKPAPAPAPMAAAVAVHEPIVEEVAEEEPEEAQEDETEEFVDPAEKRPVDEPEKKKKVNPLLYGGFAALALFVIFAIYSARPKSTTTQQSGDLGPGIFAVSGLRGHLDAKWDGDAKSGRLAYQLRIEPMEERWGPGFSRVALNPPMPISINVRLLDASGFALCGKEVDLRFNPQNAAGPMAAGLQVGPGGKKLSLAERVAAQQSARQTAISQMQAAEAQREQGKDIFQNQVTNDGQVTALNAQGTLPCSPDQFKRADYWDFNTNFPTLAEQAAILDPRLAAAQHAKEFEPPAHPEKRTLSRLLQQGYIIQGDDRVTGYDPIHGLLLAEEGKAFLIDKRAGRSTASAWASNYSLIHYKCDQHANCSLSSPGGLSVLRARLNE